MKNLSRVILSVVLASGIIVAIDTDSFANEEVSTKKEVVKKEIVQYGTERETHLYNKVEKTVDLPGFGDYQDLLASYAYNTCKKVVDDTGTYSCENLVKTRNAENGGWRRDAKNTTNSNGTHDGGLCQLNSAYHLTFIKSKWFENPLAQLDYCLQVRVDAKNKGKMPRYAYNVRHKRDKGIKFLGSNKGVVNIQKEKTINYYQKAKDQEARTQKLTEDIKKMKDQLLQEEAKLIEYRGDYIKSK